jgi:uncharacterized membrane protein YphA (DoxX/SURF4 family)
VDTVDSIRARFGDEVAIAPRVSIPATGGRFLLAGVFLLSGIVKSLDASSFLSSLSYYHLPYALHPLAYLVPSLEVILGLVLLLGITPARAAAGAVALLGVFSAVLLWGIHGGDLETCGCFGRLLALDPWLALARNALLIAVGVFVWSRCRTAVPAPRIWRRAVLLAATLVVATATGVSAHDPLVDASPTRNGQPFPMAGFVAAPPDLEPRTLVFLFHPDCYHCWDSVANVKELAADPALRVVGVTHGRSDQVAAFLADFRIDFPVHRFERDAFLRSFRKWPALYVVEGGVVRSKFEDHLPGLRTIKTFFLPVWTREPRDRRG